MKVGEPKTMGFHFCKKLPSGVWSCSTLWLKTFRPTMKCVQASCLVIFIFKALSKSSVQ